MKEVIIKKYICIIVTILIFVNIIYLPATSFAEETTCITYTGSTTANYGYKPDCTFTINKIVGNKFRGNFSAQNIGKYSFSENVSGFVTNGNDHFTCYFKVYFYNNLYYSNIIATVYPYEGKCECCCEGTWHLVDFEMSGTKFTFNIDPNKTIDASKYNENDMILCMKLSNYIYGYKEIETNNKKGIEDEIEITYDKTFREKYRSLFHIKYHL